MQTIDAPVEALEVVTPYSEWIEQRIEMEIQLDRDEELRRQVYEPLAAADCTNALEAAA